MEANAIYEYSKQLESVNRALDMIKQKQEMVLTKQDQLQSTLYGETPLKEALPTFTTPPLTSPTTCTQFPVMTPSEGLEIASALESCDLESLLSNITN